MRCLRPLVLACLMIGTAAAQPARALPAPIDVNTATVEQLRARLPPRLVEPITKYRQFYKGYASIDQLVDALSNMTFGAHACAAPPCPPRLTEAERGQLRAVLRVGPK